MATPDWLLNSNIDINKFKKVDPAKFVSPSKGSKNTEKIIKKVIQNKQLKEFDPTVLFGKNGNVNKSVEDLDREILKNSQTKYIPNLNNEAGIKRFQKVEKLPITGKFDGDTIAKIEAMNNVKSEGKPQQPNIKPPVKKDTKYIPNFQTTAGIKEFQRRNKLNPDGVVGKFTIGAMEKKEIVPAGTQAAFIEMQKTPIVKNESNIIASPEDKYVYGSDGKVTEAYFNGAENQFNKLKTTDIVKNTEAAHPGSTARIAELDKLFGNGQIPREAYNYSVNAILNPNQNSTPAQTIPQPQSQGILSSIGNWFTRERTPEEKQAMRQQVYDATGVDMGGQGGLAERSAY